jgi:hypothetical protein
MPARPPVVVRQTRLPLDLARFGTSSKLLHLLMCSDLVAVTDAGSRSPIHLKFAIETH